MLFNYTCKFVLFKKTNKNNHNIEDMDYTLHRSFGDYELYIKNDAEIVIEQQDNGSYIMVEGRFWDDLKEHADFSEILNSKEEECCRLLKNINGVFSGIFYNDKNKTCYLFADRFGYQTVFHTSDNTIFSNSQFALINLVGYKPDTMSFFEHIILEHPLGKRTYFQNIKRVGSLDIAKCTPDNYEEIFIPIKSDGSSSLECLERSFDNIFEKVSAHDKSRYGISLSMGKDSRILLYFLNKHDINYDVFTFQYEPTHMEYINVQKIASFLGKEAFLVPFEDISSDMIISSSEVPCFSNEFYRLGKYVKQNNVDYLFLGFVGDTLSGKLRYFRQFGINSITKCADAHFRDYQKGIQRASFENLGDPFHDAYETVRKNCRDVFEKYSKYELAKAEAMQNLENFDQKRVLTSIKYSGQNVNLILPFTETGIYHAYFNLPDKYISSQQVHTKLAARAPSASAVCSIGLPINIPLSREIYIRKVVQILNKFKNLTHKKEPADPCTELNLHSDVLSSFLKKSKLNTTDKLAIRVKCLDDYFNYVENHFSQSS